MSVRINHLAVIIGTIGTGKTTYTRELMKRLGYKVGGKKKLLVLDTIDHPAYRDIPAIPAKDVKRWKSGVYRTYGNDVQGILEEIARYMNNCMLVFEDATNYFSYRALTPLERKLLVHRKQVNVDIVMIFHDWGYVPPDIFRLCNTITLFRTMENPKYRKQYLPNFENVLKVWERVQKKAATNPYYNETILMQ